MLVGYVMANYPPLKNGVKKIKLVDVKKSALFERSEFADFSPVA